MAESMGTDNARNHAVIVGVTLGWRLRPERTVKVGNAAGTDPTPSPTLSSTAAATPAPGLPPLVR